MSLVFFYPQFKKLTGAERLILKLADYTARRLGPDGDVTLFTHRFADECRPALGKGVRLVETGWPLEVTGNHYLDAAVEYALGPALALRLPLRRLNGVVFFGPPSVPAMWFARRILFRIASKRVPVLYFCFEPPRFIYSDTMDIVARLGGIVRLLRPAFTLYQRLDRRMVGAAHRVLSNSPYGSRRIWDAYRRKAVVIEHGVDFATPTDEEVSGLRARYGLGGRAVAVTVNHLHPRKRIDLFLRSVHLAGGRVPNATALVVGDGPERERLYSLTGELGMEAGRDVVFAGAVPEKELPAHYALGNVYVHTGREESFGLSVIEALRLGLPVVSVDEGGPRDTVQHGVSGCLVAPTPEALSDAIAGLLSQPDRAHQMGRAGARFVSEHFRWERGAATLLRVLQIIEERL
ncbi:MAG TPA: glycosyltransferase family 4 protein [Chloroflexia bacterium]|nr:glycosyltransferase family 4 protein [Chloroflexia bacterium]